MAVASAITQSGIRDPDLYIDGVRITMPRRLTPNRSLRQSTRPLMNGRAKVTIPYDGAGLPDGPDIFRPVLDFQFGSTAPSSEQALVESLMTSGSVHSLVFWKKYVYTYTMAPGQAMIYLPRPDAYSLGFSGKAGAAYKATVTIAGTPVTPTYAASVVAGTAVTAGQFWISNNPDAHPESGALTALCKLGTPYLIPVTLTYEYVPCFTVMVSDVLTQPFDADNPFSEDKSVTFVEV